MCGAYWSGIVVSLLERSIEIPLQRRTMSIELRVRGYGHRYGSGWGG
jgi:hypothetical protein